MTKTQCVTGPCLDHGRYLLATLQSVRRCPARSDFIELCFETDEGPWTWCFRDPDERTELESSGTLALKMGPYGAQAHHADADGLGLAVPSSEALPMILGGARTYVARKLVERGW